MEKTMREQFIQLFDDIEKQLTQWNEEIDKQKESFRSYPVIFLYGAGSDGGEIVKYLGDALSDKEVYFIDKNKLKHNKEITAGIVCYGPEKMYGYSNGIVIITSSGFADEIEWELSNNKNLTLPVVADFSIMLIRRKELMAKLAERDDLINLFDWLDDEESRNILYRDNKLFLRWRSFKNFDVNDYLVKEGNFLPARFENLSGDILCCGAFLDDTVKELAKYPIKHLYALDINRLHMAQCQKANTDDRITFINVGLGSKNHRPDINSCDHSNFSEYGYLNFSSDEYVDIKSLDSLIADKVLPEDISFIKLSMRCAERPALEGMKDTIIRNRPTLAIGCYEHYKLEQEYASTLAAYLKSLVPDYKFMLRSHFQRAASLQSKFVLYAFVE